MESISIVLSLIRSFKDPIISVLGNSRNEVLDILENGTARYIDAYYKKFQSCKTFLYYNHRVDFYKTYYPLELKSNDSSVIVNSIEDLYGYGSFVSIIGDAGSGKTMHMRHLFLLAIKQRVKIPIFIELRRLNQFEGSIEKYLKSAVSNLKIATGEWGLDKLFSTGKFLFLFDGYDELVVCQLMIFGYTDLSLILASSTFICQSTPRCLSLIADDQALMCLRKSSISANR